MDVKQSSDKQGLLLDVNRDVYKYEKDRADPARKKNATENEVSQFL